MRISNRDESYQNDSRMEGEVGESRAGGGQRHEVIC